MKQEIKKHMAAYIIAACVVLAGIIASVYVALASLPEQVKWVFLLVWNIIYGATACHVVGRDYWKKSPELSWGCEMSLSVMLYWCGTVIAVAAGYVTVTRGYIMPLIVGGFFVALLFKLGWDNTHEDRIARR